MCRPPNASTRSSKNSATMNDKKKQEDGLSPGHIRRLMAHHDYHDHSQDIPSNERVLDPTEFRMRCAASAPFPIKLQEMLDRVQEDGYEDIVSWQPHGRCFCIHRPKAFQELLPKYFKLSKVASFQRQLNLYGFQRLTIGRDKGGYYHELFLRGMAFLAYRIPRVKVKGTGVRARSNPDEEPCFWDMPWVNSPTSASSFTANENSEEIVETSRAMNRSYVKPSCLSSSPSVVSHDEEDQTQPLIPKSVATDENASDMHWAEEWGKPFYSLDDPTAIIDKKKHFDDLDDEVYMDHVLDLMMKEWPSNDEGATALYQVFS